MARQLPVYPNQYALVDDCDHDRLSGHYWYRAEAGHVAGYITVNGRFKPVVLDQVILKATEREQVVHLNDDPMDCRRENLRFWTPQSGGTQGPHSVFRGMGWHKRRQKYHARIQLQGIRYHLGFFDDAETAALAYDAAARRLFGNDAECNYPAKRTPRSVAILVAQKLS